MNTVKTELCEMRWDSTELFEIHIYKVFCFMCYDISVLFLFEAAAKARSYISRTRFASSDGMNLLLRILF